MMSKHCKQYVAFASQASNLTRQRTDKPVNHVIPCASHSRTVRTMQLARLPDRDPLPPLSSSVALVCALLCAPLLSRPRRQRPRRHHILRVHQTCQMSVMPLNSTRLDLPHIIHSAHCKLQAPGAPRRTSSQASPSACRMTSLLHLFSDPSCLSRALLCLSTTEQG